VAAPNDGTVVEVAGTIAAAVVAVVATLPNENPPLKGAAAVVDTVVAADA
jgi:hypothetical protein